MESFGIAKLSGKAFVDGDLAVEVKEMTFGAFRYYLCVFISVCESKEHVMVYVV